VPTEPAPLTLSEAVHRAVEACGDPNSPGLDDLLERFQDDDEPIAALGDVEGRLIRALGPPELDEEDPALTMARAVVVYLAHRRDEVEAEPTELLRLAARAEFHGEPPEHVARWLEEQGVSL
jgi:hypothetical protein